MKYKVVDHANAQIKIFDTNAEAMAALPQIRADYLIQEASRFSVAYEVVDGNNTTWTAADLDTATDEDITYHVFNTFTGQHEQIVGAAAARLRRETIKAEFLTSAGLDNPAEISDLEAMQYLDILNIKK